MKTSGTRFFLHCLASFLVTILLPAFAYAQPSVGTTTFDGLVDNLTTLETGHGFVSATDAFNTGWNFSLKHSDEDQLISIRGLTDYGDERDTIDDDVIQFFPNSSSSGVTEYFSFSSSDGSEFQLDAFKMNVAGYVGTQMSIAGYRDGSLIDSTSLRTISGSSWETIDISSNTNFDNVDEIKIFTNTNRFSRLSFDDITISAAVASNTAPYLNSSASASVDENTSTGTVILDVNADDGDGGANDANVTYSLSGTDAADFSIDSDDGEIRFAVAPDFENPADDGTNNVYNITVTADDGGSSDNTTTQDITIEVNDLNDNTPVITASQSFSVDEQESNGAVVGTVAATDGDAFSSLSGWTITSGNEDGVFAINSSTGQITVLNNSDLDFETTESYTLTLVVNDGTNTSSSETVTIEVNDLNDNSPVVTASQSFSVDEDAANSTVVGTVNATDADANSSFSGWSIISGNGDGVFAINSSTGQITVVNNSNLNYQTTSSYSLNVIVTDGTNTSSGQTVTINVNEIDNTAPTLDFSELIPNDNATGVAIDELIVITFSEEIDKDAGEIIITDVTNNVLHSSYDVDSDDEADIEPKPGTIGIVGNKIYINPSGGLSYGTEYAIRIDASAITDNAGNSFAGIDDNTTFNFTTRARPLEFQSSSPEANAANVSATSDIALTFNYDLDSSTITTTNISIRGQQSGSIAGSWSVENEVATFNPVEDLTAGEVIHVEFPDSIASNAGSKVRPKAFSFTVTPADTVGLGAEWTSASSPEFNRWRSVTYGNGRFVAVSQFEGTDRVMYSDDGLSWSSASAPETNQWFSVTYGNGRFVAVSGNGTNQVMFSEDGETWTAASATENNGWKSVTFGNGRFVAVSSTGTNRVMYSDDGETWSSASATEDNTWNSVTYGNGRFVAVSSTGTNRVMYSDDGQNWTATAATVANDWSSVTYGNGLFVAGSSGGDPNRVMYSVNGETWSAVETNVNGIKSVAYGNGRFVAVTSVGTDRVIYSSDGANWESASATEAVQWISVVYGDGRFVAVSYDGQIMYTSKGFRVTETAGSTLTSESGSLDSLNIVLSSQPASDVVITLTSGDTGEGTIDKSSLTFTSANWDTPQTVTVTGIDDDIIDGTINYDITLAVDDANSDDAFDAAPDITIEVSNSDDDAAGFTIAQSDGTTSTTEAGGEDTFTVVLDAEPASNVVIDVTSGDTGEATAVTSSLTFTSANWDTPQTVTVTGVDDDIIDGSQTFNITMSIDDGASDDDFDALGDQTVSVDNIDDDVAGFTISESDGNTEVSEAGTSDSFKVVLDAEPGSNVVIDVSSDDTGEATVSAASLTFTSANWDTPQTVTITGVDDTDLDGDQTSAITLSINTGASDDDFDALGDQTVSVTTTDDDAIQVTVNDTTITEGATGTETLTFTVRLSAPAQAGGISVDYSTSDSTAIAGSDYTAATGTVSFAEGESEKTIAVTVTGDETVERDEVLKLSLSNLSGDNVELSDTSANGTITNDDAAIVTMADVTDNEDVGTVTITLVLDNAVDGGFDVDVSTSDNTATVVDSDYVAVTNQTVTFAGTAGEMETITITLGADSKIENNEVIDLAMSGLVPVTVDAGDIDITDGAIINILNDDVAGFTVSQTDGNTTVSETGTSDSFTVELNAQPESNVVLTVTSGDTGEGTVSAASLTFTSGNWDTPQTITITGVDDTDLDGDVSFNVTLAVDDASSDDNFDALGDQTVSVTTTDDDIPGITVSESNETTITSETGTTDSFKVVLDIAPASDVVIDITSEDLSEGTVSPSSLVFTSVNWNTSQTVTVTGVDDSIDDDTVSYAITLSVNDASSNDVYDDVEDLSVTVYNADDDTAGFTIADQDIDRFTSEGGETASFTVVLNTQPVSDVVLNVTSDNTGEGTTDISSLTFTSVNWDTPQTVTVTGADDDVDDGGVSYNINLSVNAASSDDAFDGLSSKSVEVLNYDDDSAGFTVVESNDNTSVNESGTTDSFTVVLESEPTSDVVINVSSGDTGEGTLDVSSLTFTSANWDTPQTVTVSGVDDDIIDGTVLFSIFLSVDDASSDDNYDYLNDEVLTATNTDDDTAKLVFTDVQGNEDEGSITVTATLDQAVEGGFTVEVSTSDSSATTVDSDYTSLTGETLTFSGNANETQQFSITPNSDDKVETNEIVKLTFGNLSTSVNIDITDIGYFTILNDDSAPVFTSVDSVEVEENQALILTVQASDVDEGTTIEYSITGGVDQSLFNIDEDSGELSFNSAPNFEDPTDSDSDNEYLVQIQATDGANEVLQDVVINVTDKNEFTPVITSVNSAIAYEGSAVDTEVLTVTSSDDDGTSSLTYTISENVNGDADGTNAFAINSLSGIITLSDPDDLDRDSNPELEIEVTVSDGQFETVQTILITVLTPPVAESLSPLDGAEGIALNGSISMTFDQSVESVDLSGITLTDANSSSISGLSPTLSDSTISLTYSGLNNLTEYTVTIPAGAVENSDGVGNIRIEWSFTTIVEAPEQVVLLTPESGDGSISVKPGFTWESIARAETAVFQISTESDFATDVTEISDISTTELTLTDSIQFYQKYFWRVRGINDGGEGPWSEVSSFITEASVPDLVFPSDGQNGISTAPKMRWASPHEGTSYQFQFSTTETLDNILRDVMLTEQNIQLQGLTADAEYFWRVRIVTDSTTSEWSEIQNFYTRPNPSVVETAPLPVTITFGQGTPGDTTGGGQSSGPVEQTDYRMVGLPGTDAIRLDEFFEGPYKKSWRAFIETGDDLNFYDEYSADDDRFIFTPGLGFWVLSTEIVADQYSFTAVETDENDSYGIKVHEGWNIIANPYQSEVEWDLVLEYNNISGEIFGYDEQFLTSDTMKVLQGYYFYNAPEFSMDTLFIPYTGFDQRGQEKQRSPIDLNGVNKLVLEAKIGKEISHNVEIIYSDTMDAYKERIATNYPDLSFAKTGMVLSEEKDSREKKSRVLGTYKPESEMYHVEVKGKVGSSLTWNAQFEGLAEDAAVLLVNSVTNESKIITRTETFKIQISEPLSRYNMYVGQLNYLIELEERLIPDQIVLHPNYPNPFNPSTTINYALKERVDVRLEVYDVLGRLVQTLVNEQQDAGWHKVRFDGSSLSSGMYFYRLHAGGELKLGKMTLIK